MILLAMRISYLSTCCVWCCSKIEQVCTLKKLIEHFCTLKKLIERFCITKSSNDLKLSANCQRNDNKSFFLNEAIAVRDALSVGKILCPRIKTFLSVKTKLNDNISNKFAPLKN